MTSLIHPPIATARAPLRRSTVAAGLGAVFMLFLIGAVVAQQNTRMAPGAADPAASDRRSGGQAAISEELAAQGFGSPARKGIAPGTALSAASRPAVPPVPSALMTSGGTMDGLLAQVDEEREALARASRSLVVDEPARGAVARQARRDTSPLIPVRAPAQEKFTLSEGKVIPAALGRDLNSDLPGEVVAYSTVDVYDSLIGTVPLIPKGSALVGKYGSGLRLGQERLLFAFHRLILPDGRASDLPHATGMDSGGASGISGDIDNHIFKMFASSFLVAWMAKGVEDPQPATANTTGATGNGARSAAGQVMVDVSRVVLDRYKAIPPTIVVPAGTRINVQVMRDISLPAAHPILDTQVGP
ncbi:MAG: TrbI/VirB10 family protein [Burkholderiaceae bacterium]|nr:TrbI/VirB10 family protein [Burkholderiaceae bacterium]